VLACVWNLASVELDAKWVGFCCGAVYACAIICVLGATYG
jgi:hypothetical protein